MTSAVAAEPSSERRNSERSRLGSSTNSCEKRGVSTVANADGAYISPSYTRYDAAYQPVSASVRMMPSITVSM